MADEQSLKPTLASEEEHEEFDEGEESDVYEIEGEEEGDSYEPDEDEDEDVDEVAEGAKRENENMTALLLGIQNGSTRVEDEEEEEEEEEEDEEYLEEGEGSAENPIDLSSVAGSKRSVDELEDGVYDDEDEDDGGETVAKKARV